MSVKCICRFDCAKPHRSGSLVRYGDRFAVLFFSNSIDANICTWMCVFMQAKTQSIIESIIEKQSSYFLMNFIFHLTDLLILFVVKIIDTKQQ